MGVPDFLKFAARVSPDALCRVPKTGNAAPIEFDFVLVDATNVFQTIGLHALSEFLLLPKLHVKRAVIFTVDAQRHRAGTARSHRTHATVLDTDVSMQQLCCKLQDHYKQRGGKTASQVLVSGRQIAGEADYKILDIQRNLVTQALAAGEDPPTFCFVSEDSDVLSGALCGPAPYTVSIATKLHDTMFEMCILRLSHVLAYVAMCVDAVGSEGVMEQPSDVDNLVKKNKIEEKENMEKEEEKNEKVEEEVFRRKKQDGPMVATGTRVVLSDSDSDNDDDENDNSKESEKQNVILASAMPVITEQQIAAAEILQNSCVDLVFLFVVVMGNGSNVPPVIRGVTKVDIQSCWKAYCRMKYDTADPGREKEMGRNLICLHDSVGLTEQQTDRMASITIDCSFLRSIIEAAHYADAQSRPPVEEEKERALLFLSQATYTTLRYIVACNVDPDAARDNTFLDARPLMETEVAVPSLAAFLWVLGQTRKKTLHFPLVGLATEEVLSSAARGSSAVEAAVSTAAARTRGKGNEQNVILQWDVANTLVTPDVGLPQTVRLYKLLPSASNGVVGKTFMDRLRYSVEQTLGNNTETLTRKTKMTLLSSIIVLWQKSITPYMSTLDHIARRVHLISPFTGTVVSGRAAETASAKDVPAAQTTGVKMSYSFELRRMAPVLTSGEEKSLSAPTASAALLSALRVSYDYATAPQTPPSIIVCENNNTAGGTRFSETGKRKKYMRGKDKAEGENVDDTDLVKKKMKTNVSGNTTASFSDSAEVKPEKYRRPGKKEREKLKKKYTNNK
ncbi:hypothetical protein LSM04_003524 [Trypanosoma melophagium]|uniref:uncharacterized protein n=1 Tax=Trypanosoma melophagium TaxID=715481 RepID=UPI00351A4309|nr:hypothetical protein LSM04_003524 [Trypanosoma melophagium]